MLNTFSRAFSTSLAEALAPVALSARLLVLSVIKANSLGSAKKDLILTSRVQEDQDVS